MAQDDNNGAGLLEMTADIVSSFVSNNRVEPAEIGPLISSVHAALGGVGKPEVEPEEIVEKPSSQQIRRSITDDGLISFLDGRTYKSLKRHLGVKGFTPAQYRETFGLKDDYPMVAPAYSRARSELAKSMGLGAKGRQTKSADSSAAKASRKSPGKRASST